MKSRTTAGILALLLGGAGIHKFYLNKPVMGIIYLLLCWTFIPAIISLFEAINYFFFVGDKSFDKRYNKRFVKE